jgi:crotonobetainyl-CoA:carnitine CoA-transferase CaiB-like acyl-CoA transferase
MAMKEALEAAMRSGSAEQAVSALQANGAAVATLDTMTQAVHDVYCGIMADHEHPNEKDRAQAQQLLDALSKAPAN